MHLYRPELFFEVGPRDQTQLIRFGSKHSLSVGPLKALKYVLFVLVIYVTVD